GKSRLPLVQLASNMSKGAVNSTTLFIRIGFNYQYDGSQTQRIQKGWLMFYIQLVKDLLC
ncbi:MAG TPA: hypothetical protein PKD90_18505, partial [Phnomibacter sp.]|nr:hypothetical protein [Phnomibacter sp.]